MQSTNWIISEPVLRSQFWVTCIENFNVPIYCIRIILKFEDDRITNRCIVIFMFSCTLLCKSQRITSVWTLIRNTQRLTRPIRWQRLTVFVGKVLWRIQGRNRSIRDVSCKCVSSQIVQLSLHLRVR